MPEVAPNAWYVRERPLDDGRWAVTAYLSDEHPDGGVVAGELAHTDGVPVLWRTVESTTGMMRIIVDLTATPGAPPLWFVHVDEPGSFPRATNLVAFGTDHFEPGTVVGKYRFATAGVPSTEQAGAIRWYPDTATVHQVFVSENWRRMLVGSSILHVADAFHQGMGWPGHLHGDGRRTDLGQQFMAGLRHPARFASLERVMPPMDPSAP